MVAIEFVRSTGRRPASDLPERATSSLQVHHGAIDLDRLHNCGTPACRPSPIDQGRASTGAAKVGDACWGPHVSDQLYELACEAFDLAREYMKQEMPEKSLAEADQIIAQYFVIARTRSKPERDAEARAEMH